MSKARGFICGTGNGFAGEACIEGICFRGDDCLTLAFSGLGGSGTFAAAEGEYGALAGVGTGFLVGLSEGGDAKPGGACLALIVFPDGTRLWFSTSLLLLFLGLPVSLVAAGPCLAFAAASFIAMRAGLRPPRPGLMVPKSQRSSLPGLLRSGSLASSSSDSWSLSLWVMRHRSCRSINSVRY